MNPEGDRALSDSRLRQLWRRLTTRTHIEPLERFGAYIASLSLGDRVVAYACGALVVVASLVSLYALEQHFLVSVPTYGGSLTEGSLGNPRFVHPLLAISDADRDLVALTYAGLMGVGREGTLLPVLAEKYDISPDGKTYTFILRENAVFSDGSAVTAEDVAFTVQKAQDPGVKSPEYANWSGVLVATPDTRTVVFTLSKPYAPFLQNTTLGILPAKLWRAIPAEQFPFSTLALEPVGAGPFKPSSISRDAAGLITGYSLAANPRYVLGRPYLSNLTFRFFSREDELVKALKDGDVESAYGQPEKSTLVAPYSRVFGVFLNASNNTTLARLEVRKALSLSINRLHITEDVLGGYATPLMGPVPPGTDITETPVAFFEDATREGVRILEGAGWKYDTTDRAWKHAQAKLTFDALTVKTSNVPELKAVASAIKADWERLGIRTTIELYEPGDLNQNVIRPRKYDALLFGMVVGRDQDLYAFWDSKERNDPGLNIALYTNKVVDELLEKIRATSDTTLRRADLQKIEDTVAADYPAAFTHAPHFVYAVPEDLEGVSLPQITTPADRFAAVHEWHRVTESVWPFLILNR